MGKAQRMQWSDEEQASAIAQINEFCGATLIEHETDDSFAFDYLDDDAERDEDGLLVRMLRFMKVHGVIVDEDVPVEEHAELLRRVASALAYHGPWKARSGFDADPFGDDVLLVQSFPIKEVEIELSDLGIDRDLLALVAPRCGHAITGTVARVASSKYWHIGMDRSAFEDCLETQDWQRRTASPAPTG